MKIKANISLLLRHVEMSVDDRVYCETLTIRVFYKIDKKIFPLFPKEIREDICSLHKEEKKDIEKIKSFKAICLEETKKEKLIERAKKMIEKDLEKDMKEIYSTIDEINKENITIEFEIKK